MRRLILFLGLFFIQLAVDQADEPSTLVVTDLHGDLDALSKILIDEQMVDSNTGAWISRRDLVVLGDSVGNGPDSIATLLYLYLLHQQGLSNPSLGKVRYILGNHEWMHAHLLPDALLQWLGKGDSLLVVRGNLLVHAGLDPRFVKKTDTVDFLNHAASAWFRAIKLDEARPSPDTDWLTTTKGPFWTNAYRLVTTDIMPHQLNLLLDQFSVERMILGHLQVEEVIETHPVFGARVVMLDTGASIAMGGRIRSLEIREDGSLNVHRHDRIQHSYPFVSQFRESCRSTIRAAKTLEYF